MQPLAAICRHAALTARLRAKWVNRGLAGDAYDPSSIGAAVLWLVSAPEPADDTVRSVACVAIPSKDIP
jgi:hypothetical protein